MAYEERDMSGTLRKNDRKEKPNQPDYWGSAKIDGIEYRMSAWVKDGRDGSRFMSFSFERKDDARRGRPEGRSRAAADLDDEVPF